LHSPHPDASNGTIRVDGRPKVHGQNMLLPARRFRAAGRDAYEIGIHRIPPSFGA
jgi:hypothetical protein